MNELNVIAELLFTSLLLVTYSICFYYPLHLFKKTPQFLHFFKQENLNKHQLNLLKLF